MNSIIKLIYLNGGFVYNYNFESANNVVNNRKWKTIKPGILKSTFLLMKLLYLNIIRQNLNKKDYICMIK